MTEERRQTGDGTTEDGATETRADCALAAARAGAERASEGFRTQLTIEQKDATADSVTAYDRAAQRAALERIARTFPDEPIAAEEEDVRKRVPATGPAWAVDPIDGTNNYVGGGRVWATSVAAVVDCDPVAAATIAPALGDAYTADDTARRNGEPITVSTESDPERFLINPVYGLSPRDRRELAATVETITTRFGDLRRIGCTQLALAAVASGELHAVVSTVTLNDWDTIAGVGLVRRAGGRVTDASGARWEPDATGLVASNDTAHDLLLDAFEPVDE